MNNFTPRAQQVLALARKEADRLHHNYVGTEHMLLGVIRLGQGGAVHVLQKFGIDLETIRIEVEKQIEPGPDTKMSGNIPYTPRVKKVLALAGKEAQALGNQYVGTQHVLLGIMVEGDGAAARILASHGVKIESARPAAANEPAADSLAVEPAGYVPRAFIPASYAKLEEEFRRTREELLNKFETVVGLLNALQADVAQLRIDSAKGN
jgi:ATP-dependent Clp protease ATP-binding subunit ClpC